ncbi:hypothetical protein ACSBR2_003215 [Camellia fascicularis]
MSQLGWIAGPLAMLLFASVTFVSAFSLCHCYRSPDPGPKRNPSYLEAVRTILGESSKLVKINDHHIISLFKESNSLDIPFFSNNSDLYFI